MRNRRFAFLAGVLLALNLALWLAPEGLALRQAAISEIFGSKLVRADVVSRQGGSIIDTRYDRGVITAVTPSQITIEEVDGRVQAIAVSSSTRLNGLVRSAFPITSLKPGWRVLVTWSATGPATTIKVEKRAGSGRGSGHQG